MQHIEKWLFLKRSQSIVYYIAFDTDFNDKFGEAYTRKILLTF